MINEEKLRFRRGDIVAIAAVLIFAVILFVFSILLSPKGEMHTALVYQNGTLLYELSLEQNSEYRVDGEYTNVISVRNGAVAITESTCPGKDCTHTGYISEGGRSIVCLPNRVEIVLSGDSVVDAFTQ